MPTEEFKLYGGTWAGQGSDFPGLTEMAGDLPPGRFVGQVGDALERLAAANAGEHVSFDVTGTTGDDGQRVSISCEVRG